MTTLPLRLGLAMWSHAQWQPDFYGAGTKAAERLARYADVFHTVEGNTTFYATPSPATVNNWRDATHDAFKFTFKLPKAITHQQMLKHTQPLLHEFLTVMEPLIEKVGQWTIQLPAAFGPQHLGQLQQFCRQFPADFPLGVEVRHLAFFAKGPEEQALNQWLSECGIDRIIMDSRPVFAAMPTNAVIIDAQNKKPKVPVHAVATAHRPLIRFIGHPEQQANEAFFTPWLNKLPQWIAQGKQPYLMIHTPDNVAAPQLARTLYQQLSQHIPLPPLAAFPGQTPQSQLSMF